MFPCPAPRSFFASAKDTRGANKDFEALDNWLDDLESVWRLEIHPLTNGFLLVRFRGLRIGVNDSDEDRVL